MTGRVISVVMRAQLVSLIQLHLKQFFPNDAEGMPQESLDAARATVDRMEDTCAKWVLMQQCR